MRCVLGTLERRHREKEQLRTRILDAARDLFVTEGFEAVSMRKIAEAIEYSPTAIYTLFKDKEELMRELCGHDFATLAGEFNRLAGVADPIHRIQAIGRTYIRFAITYPNHYRLMFMTIHTVGPTEEELAHKKGNPDQDAYAMLFHAVVQGIAQNRFRPEFSNAHLLAQTFWAGVHGVASLEITHGRDPWLEWVPMEERIEAMVQGVIRGLLVHPDEGSAA